jgi:hypothetical protein
MNCKEANIKACLACTSFYYTSLCHFKYYYKITNEMDICNIIKYYFEILYYDNVRKDSSYKAIYWLRAAIDRSSFRDKFNKLLLLQ